DLAGGGGPRGGGAAGPGPHRGPGLQAQPGQGAPPATPGEGPVEPLDPAASPAWREHRRALPPDNATVSVAHLQPSAPGGVEGADEAPYLPGARKQRLVTAEVFPCSCVLCPRRSCCPRASPWGCWPRRAAPAPTGPSSARTGRPPSTSSSASPRICWIP